MANVFQRIKNILYVSGPKTGQQLRDQLVAEGYHPKRIYVFTTLTAMKQAGTVEYGSEGFQLTDEGRQKYEGRRALYAP